MESSQRVILPRRSRQGELALVGEAEHHHASRLPLVSATLPEYSDNYITQMSESAESAGLPGARRTMNKLGH
jgi:hypothetical protein